MNLFLPDLRLDILNSLTNQLFEARSQLSTLYCVLLVDESICGWTFGRWHEVLIVIMGWCVLVVNVEADSLTLPNLEQFGLRVVLRQDQLSFLADVVRVRTKLPVPVVHHPHLDLLFAQTGLLHQHFQVVSRGVRVVEIFYEPLLQGTSLITVESGVSKLN